MAIRIRVDTLRTLCAPLPWLLLVLLAYQLPGLLLGLAATVRPALGAGTPGNMTLLLFAQFVVVAPLVWWIGTRAGPAREVFALRPPTRAALQLWPLLILLFLAAQFLLHRLFEIPAGAWLESIAGSGHWGLTAAVVLAAPLLEELLFRGWLLHAWSRPPLGRGGAVLISAAVFTALHAGQYHAVQLGELFVFALMLGAARLHGRSLYLPLALHAANNALAAAVVIHLGWL